MDNNEVFSIGIMSGTSLDGIDFVYVQFDKKNYTDFTILASKTVAYSKDWKQKLQNAILFSDEELGVLDINYGVLLGKETNQFIDEFKIDTIDFIASHGHTILHQPDKGITLQVGDGQVIADKTSHKVVCDFRTQDVKLGGQGAPLVPIGDELLFFEYDYCLNLGGFANVSFKKNNKRIAFDICPVNIVMNFYAEKLGVEYDDKGQITSTGNINIDLLEKLNLLTFYQQKPPKSLGLEWVKKEIFPIIDLYKIPIKDMLRTYVEHIAIQITNQLKNKTKVLVTGGGAFNDFLISRIKFLNNVEFIIPSKKLINFKEALVFSFLGLLRTENKVNCLKSVTGAKRNHSSGDIFYPKNFKIK